jgi:tetratricopeptide (TPR) repeat protein
MFLAGEVAALILHRDLGLRSRAVMDDAKGFGAADSGSFHERFAGWPVLKDLEGRSHGDPAVSRIRTRFLVARIVRSLVEDELVVDPDTLHRQVDRVRREFDDADGETPEKELWERVLQTTATSEWEELNACLLDWGKVIAGAGHLHGAGEVFRLAFGLARLLGSSHPALDSARYLGKILRTRAQWEEALAWYGVAQGIAEDLEDPGKMAVVLDGLGNTFRDRGNLPKARETLLEVLAIGRATGDRYATAVGHHDLMTVEKLSGDLISAIQHGWQAVQNYDSQEGSLRALFDLSGVLRESGEFQAARDGYSVVADRVAGFEYRVLALDALALIAALEGDVPTYRSIRDRMEAVGWRDLSPVYQGQALYYRGVSSRALGWVEEGRKWFENALEYAEAHELNKLIFDVEKALSESSEVPEIPTPPLGAEPEPFGEKIRGVRSGLSELRRAEANASSPT